jgi:hypothetical protein
MSDSRRGQGKAVEQFSKPAPREAPPPVSAPQGTVPKAQDRTYDPSASRGGQAHHPALASVASDPPSRLPLVHRPRDLLRR